MNKDWAMSEESFEALLDWLASDREQAGIKYEQIRSGLIKFFAGRGHSDAEDLADKTINRVASRLNEIRNKVQGDRAPYFYGVARKVLLEHNRRKQPAAPPGLVGDSGRVEVEHRCLEECIAKLSAENRRLVLGYYQSDGREKINQRRLLAEKLGIAPNALRIRAYRIRAELQKCVKKCVERSDD
jgi:DNA-directed RNA polymerase specialized sigma24 family protein